MTPVRRLLVLGTVVAGLAAAAIALPLERVPDHIARLGGTGPLAAVGLGAVLLAALVPRTVISLACGALLGALGGAACALAAALVAAAVTFGAGRWLGRDFVAARAPDRLAGLDAWLARRGLLAVVVVRMIPLAPFGLVGYAYGCSSVRLGHYLLGTLIGATPSAFSYAIIGAAVVAPGSLDAVSLIPAACGVVISAGAALYWRRTRARAPGR